MSYTAELTPTKRNLVRALWVAALVGLSIFAVRTVTSPDPAGGAAFEVLYVLVYVAAGALCISRSLLVRAERGPWLAFGLGMVAWAGGYAYYFAFLQDLESPPYPSPSDALWLTYYVCAFGALIALLRKRIANVKKSLWVDAGIGALALGAVSAALLVDPIVESTGASVVAAATNLAYPLSDVLIMGVILGAFALTGWRPGRSWYLLGLSFVLFMVFDTVYLYEAANGTYTSGTPLDLTWPAWMLLVAFAAWQRPAPVTSGGAQGLTAAAIPMVFALVALSLTTYDSFVGVTKVAVVLSTVTLLLAFVRTVTAFADVRSLSRSRELLAQNQSILDSAGDGIYGIDTDGRITFANPATAAQTGYAVDELVGREAHPIFHHTRADGSPYPAEQCQLRATILDGAVHEDSDDLYWRKDGTSFPIEYTSTPLRREQTITGAVVVFKDVTERREMERMKDEFISVVSHELRTPLTSIRGSLGLLESGTLGELPAKGQRMVEIAVSNTDRLVRLINDILDIERIESGRVTMETQRLSTAELVEGAVEGVRSMANEGGVRIETSVRAEEVMADGDRVTQVLTNLLSNAIKFSPPESVVRVSSERHHGQVRLTVSDEGRGIPAERLGTIFERFQQVDASDSRQKGGTGLGLAIARTIVHQHGGEIWAESSEGQGSSFHFTLPLAERERTTVADHDGAGARVLICDDDPSVVEVIASMVNARGYAAIPATSGREAVELALEQTPDVVVLDMLMPEMSGWEVAAALNERPETAAIPLVILSVLAAKEAEQPEDVVEWLEKPPSEETLFRALETALAPRGERPRVLVVEDDLDLAGVLTETFERRGLEVFHALDGGQAIELSERIRPDLLVLDLVLPQTDGFEVVDWLRHHDRLKSLPIMVYTAKDLDAEERHRLQGAGTQVFTKSRVAPDQFEQRVMQLLRQITGGSRTEANGAEANPDRR